MRAALVSLLLLLTATAALGAPTEQIGQVVCSECWFEADRTRVPYGGEADLACAERCAAKGVSMSLAVLHLGHFDLLELVGEPIPIADDWLELTGAFVRIAGETSGSGDDTQLNVTRVRRLDENPWESTESSQPPAEAAELEWQDLGGHAQSIEALHGRFVVLNFWATWCAPCKDEMPDLIRIQDRYGMYGVQVLGAAADEAEARDHVEAFSRKLKINFPVVLGATTAQMQELDLGVALPATAIFDRHGGIVHRVRGVVERRDLERVLDALIAGEAPPKAQMKLTFGHKPHGDKHAGTHASLVPS